MNTKLNINLTTFFECTRTSLGKKRKLIGEPMKYFSKKSLNILLYFPIGYKFFVENF